MRVPLRHWLRAGAGLRHRPCRLAVAGVAPPARPPACLRCSGREGVNLPASQRECGAINTHSPAGRGAATGAQGAGTPRARGASVRGAGRGLRGPELFLGPSVDIAPASPGPHPPFALEVSARSPGGHWCHPPQHGRANFLRETIPASAAWTGRSTAGQTDGQRGRSSAGLSSQGCLPSTAAGWAAEGLRAPEGQGGDLWPPASHPGAQAVTSCFPRPSTVSGTLSGVRTGAPEGQSHRLFTHRGDGQPEREGAGGGQAGAGPRGGQAADPGACWLGDPCPGQGRCCRGCHQPPLPCPGAASSLAPGLRSR